MSVEASVVDHVVIRDVSKQVVLAEELDESGVSLNDCTQQFEAKLRDWIVVLEDDLKLGEQVFDQQVVNDLCADFGLL